MAKCMQCGGSTKMKKMAKGGMPTKVLGPAKKPFAAGIPYFTGSGLTGPESMQKGGSFAPNRAVQSSCKSGMVRDENGRCVMQRKMAKGGATEFGMLSVKAGIDKNPKPTAADRIVGATKKMKEGGNWIQGAIKRPGAFSAKAKKAGMSTSAYASSVLKEGTKASTRTKKQAVLAKTLSGMRKKK